MKKHFSYNFTNKTLVGSKTSIARANKGLNPEYFELCTLLNEHPDFTVVEKLINKKANPKRYSDLSFKRMHDYISLFSNSKERLEEFYAVLSIAEARGAKYPLTKKWFLATYPEYKENTISEEQTSSLNSAAA